MLGSKKSGKTHLVKKFGKTEGNLSDTNIYEKKVFIGNKLVHIMVTDPTATVEEQL